MNETEILEGLETALLLASVASREHETTIPAVGIVKISRNQVEIQISADQWMRLSRRNLMKCFEQLVKEPKKHKMERIGKRILFSAA